jgi:hypothetical protein
MPPPRHLISLALVVPVLALAACGDSGNGSGSSNGSTTKKQDTKTTDSRPGY